MRAIVAYLLAIFCLTANAFIIGSRHRVARSGQGTTTPSSTIQFLATEQAEETGTEIVAKRIRVKGAVQGGYYRVCVLNEVSKENQFWTWGVAPWTHLYIGQNPTNLVCFWAPGWKVSKTGWHYVTPG
jgi:hypothetical protein